MQSGVAGLLRSFAKEKTTVFIVFLFGKTSDFLF